MICLIDNGHGKETPGKCSPDGKFREYAYTREIVAKVIAELRKQGYNAIALVPEETDIALAERVRRVNSYCNKFGAANVVLVSVHCNASGNGSEWRTARGWSAYTSAGETKADKLAAMMYQEAEKNFVGHRLRTDNSDGDPDWEEGFYILRKSKCAAVLSENFFQDNEADVAYMNSAAGRQAIIRTHVDALIRYVNEYGTA